MKVKKGPTMKKEMKKTGSKVGPKTGKTGKTNGGFAAFLGMGKKKGKKS